MIITPVHNEWISRADCYCSKIGYFLPGLDAAGKTTLLYKLKLGEVVTTIPTIGERITFIQ